jgi:hypothetical protein
MAIFNVNESSLGEYLNENRSIRQGINQAKKSGLIDSDQASEAYKAVKKQEGSLRDKAKKYSDSDLQLIRKMNARGTSKHGEDRGTEALKKITGANDHTARASMYLTNKQAKQQYGRTIGAELKKRGYDPKTGEKLNKQVDPKTSEKLKEAAEYILAVLDESEKKMNL